MKSLNCQNVALVHRLVWLLIATLAVTDELSAFQECAAATPSESTAGKAAASLQKLPIKEVTVFKDGHAFVTHEGEMAVNADGEIRVNHLPAPVLGTFWPYVRSEVAELRSVVAAEQTVVSDTEALTIKELVRSNVGAEVRIEQGTESFLGEIVSVPSRRRTAEDDGDSENGAVEYGSVVMLQTTEGFRVIPLDTVREITFLKRPRSQTETRSREHLLTMQLEAIAGDPPATTTVGMTYLQRGIRWIPNYRLELTSEGMAHVTLQATLINEMGDLENVTANLVIGVPNFAFRDTVDPIALGQTTAELSRYFQEDSQTAVAFSNAIRTQVALTPPQAANRSRAAQSRASQSGDLGPDLPKGSRREDLFVFRVEEISLRKGQRMVVPVAEYKLPYEDVFTVELDIAPPGELMRRFNTQQQRELAQKMNAPRAIHQARLTNEGPYPLTTAPTLILRDGQLLGQSMMTYTPVGSQVDVEITTAVDVSVSKSEEETGRKPNAATWGGDHYDRIDLVGRIKLNNYTDQQVKLEVVRRVLGQVDELGEEGAAKRLDIREQGWLRTDNYPYWWHWHSWPTGWFHLNGISELTWDLELKSGEEAVLPYEWHYFWRH